MAHEIPYLVVVLLTAIAAAAVAVRRRVLFRMAVRNAARRKTPVAPAIPGLLGEAFRSLDQVDETIVLGGQLDFYNATTYDDLAANASEMPRVDALAPRIQSHASV